MSTLNKEFVKIVRLAILFTDGEIKLSVGTAERLKNPSPGIARYSYEGKKAGRGGRLYSAHMDVDIEKFMGAQPCIVRRS